MGLTRRERRSFLFSAFGLGVCQVLPSRDYAQPVTGKDGVVLGAAEGERLIHFRDQGEIFIKLSTQNGSDRLALGTQQIKAGTGIPTHRHLEMEEAFYVLKGSGTATLGESTYRFEQGTTIFIPTRTWHSFANPAEEVVLMWLVSPAGLDGFFRETCSPPGKPSKGLSPEQIHAIARKYATEFR